MRIPTAEADGDKADAGLHEPRRQEAALCERRFVKEFRDRRRFLRKIERRADLGRADHGERALREAVEAGEGLVVLGERIEGVVEALEQVLAAVEIGERDA